MGQAVATDCNDKHTLLITIVTSLLLITQASQTSDYQPCHLKKLHHQPEQELQETKSPSEPLNETGGSPINLATQIVLGHTGLCSFIFAKTSCTAYLKSPAYFVRYLQVQTQIFCKPSELCLHSELSLLLESWYSPAYLGGSYESTRNRFRNILWPSALKKFSPADQLLGAEFPGQTKCLNYSISCLIVRFPFPLRTMREQNPWVRDRALYI